MMKTTTTQIGDLLQGKWLAPEFTSKYSFLYGENLPMRAKLLQLNSMLYEVVGLHFTISFFCFSRTHKCKLANGHHALSSTSLDGKSPISPFVFYVVPSQFHPPQTSMC